MDNLAKIIDVFFNKRSAPPDRDPKPAVTVEELILRGVSYVRVRGHLYQVVVTKLEHSKQK